MYKEESHVKKISNKEINKRKEETELFFLFLK